MLPRVRFIIPQLETIEQRVVPATMLLQPDQIYLEIPLASTSFPATVIDPLQNDEGSGLTITSLQTGFGYASVLAGMGEGGRDVIQYEPGPDFGGFDFVMYTVTDTNGEVATEYAWVNYGQEQLPLGSWAVQVLPEILVSPESENQLTDTDGVPALSIDYSGEKDIQVGVWIHWSISDSFLFGSGFAGSLTTNEQSVDAEFYSHPENEHWYGSAYVYGSLKGVNSLIREMVYTPKEGFAPPQGVVLYADTYFYSSLGLAVGYQTSQTLIRFDGVEPVDLSSMDYPIDWSWIYQSGESSENESEFNDIGSDVANVVDSESYRQDAVDYQGYTEYQESPFEYDQKDLLDLTFSVDQAMGQTNRFEEPGEGNSSAKIGSAANPEGILGGDILDLLASPFPSSNLDAYQSPNDDVVIDYSVIASYPIGKGPNQLDSQEIADEITARDNSTGLMIESDLGLLVVGENTMDNMKETDMTRIDLLK